MTTKGRAQTATNRPVAWAFTAACLTALLPTTVSATPMTEAPSFRDEVSYLQFAIDHHFSALRITELAAGTAAVGSSSNYAGAPDVFAATPAKATNAVALSVATMANMAQRREIVEGQEFLQTYYGIDYTPSLQPYLAPLLPPLDQAAAGDEFNVAFLQIFTGHHMTLDPSSEQCATAAPNAPVRTYCANIAAAQTREISEQSSRRPMASPTLPLRLFPCQVTSAARRCPSRRARPCSRPACLVLASFAALVQPGVEVT